MKKYIQLTAGRGPVECARVITLVARELLKDFSDAELIESEPHNTVPVCQCCSLPRQMLPKRGNGTVLCYGVRLQTGIVPGIHARIGLSAWSSSSLSHFRMCRTWT